VLCKTEIYVSTLGIIYIVLPYDKLTSLTSLFILQPEDHRPMWYIHTITGDIYVYSVLIY